MDGNDYTNALLDTFSMLESSGGKNPRANKYDKFKSRGEYQLRPGAVEDVKKAFPEKWDKYNHAQITASPILSREATKDYLQVLSKQLASYGVAPTIDALIAAYNAGARGVSEGKYNKDYLNKGLTLLKENSSISPLEE